MAPPFMQVFKAFIQEFDEELGNFVRVSFQSQSVSPGDAYFKIIDNPIYKSISYGITGSVGTTVTQTVEWDNTYTGETTNHVQASATNPLLCVITGKIGNSSFPAALQDLYASNTLDTADGTKIIDTSWGLGITATVPPIPIILDVNQYLTVVISIHASFADTVTFQGFTVELPTDFLLS